MTVVTVVATAEPGSVPPRVRLNVTDSGTPEVSSVTVTRVVGGVREVVRTADGLPLQLTPTGSGTRTALLYDYTAPFGLDVSYSLSTGGSSGTVRLDSDQVWLINVGVPARSVPIDCLASSFETTEYEVTQGVFWASGRRNAVVVSEPARRSGSSTIKFQTASRAEAAKVDASIANAGVLFFNSPPSLGLAVGPLYMAVGTVRATRPVDIGSAPERDWEFPYVEVDSPAGGSQALWNLAAVQAEYSTLADIQAAFTTLGALRDNAPIGG